MSIIKLILRLHSKTDRGLEPHMLWVVIFQQVCDVVLTSM